MVMRIVRKATEKRVATVKSVVELETTLAVLPAGCILSRIAKATKFPLLPFAPVVSSLKGMSSNPVVTDNPQATVIGVLTAMAGVTTIIDGAEYTVEIGCKGTIERVEHADWPASRFVSTLPAR